LQDGLEGDLVKVVMIDPLYLCLLSSGIEADAANLFQVGPLLLNIAKACRQAGATPVIAHHSKKDLRPGEPMELEHLAYAGIAEFARQWILLNRRTSFDKETGRSELWLSVGGSAGQCGEWAVDVEEGLLNEDGDRDWNVHVLTAGEQRTCARDEAERQREEKKAQRHKEHDAKVLNAIDWLTEQPTPQPATQNAIRARAQIGSDAARVTLERLLQGGAIEKYEVVVASGKGRKSGQDATAYRRLSRG
jgi:hypothetical protein